MSRLKFHKKINEKFIRRIFYLLNLAQFYQNTPSYLNFLFYYLLIIKLKNTFNSTVIISSFCLQKLKLHHIIKKGFIFQ
jgi:hypothetical protein